MKDFNDLLNDLLENEELRAEAKKALNSDSLKITEEQYTSVVAFGKAHGYEFSEEDIHLRRAANRTLDDAELELVNGGGVGDYCTCDNKSKCDKDWGCYNDYLCLKDQRSQTGMGMCVLDYACKFTYNSCIITNKCKEATSCEGSAQ